MIDFFAKSLAAGSKRPPSMRPDFEVLREGILPEKRFYVGVCSTCRAKVRFREGAQLPPYPGHLSPHPRVSCPTKGCYGLITGYAEKPPNFSAPPRSL